MRRLVESLAGLALLFIVFLVATFPVTWLLMLFLGNVGLQLSYWGTLPLGIVVSLVIGSGSTGAYGSRWSRAGAGSDFAIAVTETIEGDEEI
jgi:hypothetical protein